MCELKQKEKKATSLLNVHRLIGRNLVIVDK